MVSSYGAGERGSIRGSGIASHMCLVSEDREVYSRHKWFQIGLTYGDLSIQGTVGTHGTNKQIS